MVQLKSFTIHPIVWYDEWEKLIDQWISNSGLVGLLWWEEYTSKHIYNKEQGDQRLSKESDSSLIKHFHTHLENSWGLIKWAPGWLAFFDIASVYLNSVQIFWLSLACSHHFLPSIFSLFHMPMITFDVTWSTSFCKCSHQVLYWSLLRCSVHQVPAFSFLTRPVYTTW